ncbi:hypothetical protein [Sphaerisporangium sp. TRM90804]|uniref:ATP-grasp domain-containing protein n=1 Tax=Sphaerisporangium sp. TRM90804 TaxID=3031113 RepID=UPI00244C3404|nr:hypothetical protein [Sphaerisporangium sp. TRM90804]MDH2425218.1 hypothetical protein [Sphaerisporangium sp. TRM90804]
MKIAYVTYDGPDDDRDVLLAVWERAGIEGRAVHWDRPDVRWADFDAAVVRSTWDYITRRDAFVEWAHRAAGETRLLNPAGVIERNTDKVYLRDLGVPVVPTHWVAPGEPVTLPDWDGEWKEYVVKPSVSSGARSTIRTTDQAVAREHAARITAGGLTAMIQPYLTMVEDEGETSLIYLGGRFSHARRRNAMLATGPNRPAGNHVATLARDPAPDQLALAERVLAEVPETLLYARVDLVRLPDATPALIELELVEPYLYLSEAPGTPERLTTALLNLL